MGATASKCGVCEAAVVGMMSNGATAVASLSALVATAVAALGILGYLLLRSHLQLSRRLGGSPETIPLMVSGDMSRNLAAGSAPSSRLRCALASLLLALAAALLVLSLSYASHLLSEFYSLGGPLSCAGEASGPLSGPSSRDILVSSIYVDRRSLFIRPPFQVSRHECMLFVSVPFVCVTICVCHHFSCATICVCVTICVRVTICVCHVPFCAFVTCQSSECRPIEHTRESLLSPFPLTGFLFVCSCRRSQASRSCSAPSVSTTRARRPRC